jgi:hypothetical protein
MGIKITLLLAIIIKRNYRNGGCARKGPRQAKTSMFLLFTTINDVKRLYPIELCGGESGDKATKSISIFMNEVWMRQNVSLNKNGNVFVVWRHKNILKLLWKFCSGKDRKINMTYRNGGCAEE